MGRLFEIRSHVDALCNKCSIILNGRDVNGYALINDNWVILPDVISFNGLCGFCAGYHKEQDFDVKVFSNLRNEWLDYSWKWVK